MAEVVVKLSNEEIGDEDRFVSALDAYAEWCSELMSDSLSDFMMTTERTLQGLNRRLIFRDEEHASRFIAFWTTQKNIIPVKRREY